MPKLTQNEAPNLASCPLCRTLIFVGRDGAISDPIYRVRSRLRATLEKARADGPPRQAFSTNFIGSHWCNSSAVLTARFTWNLRNPRHTWDSTVKEVIRG